MKLTIDCKGSQEPTEQSTGGKPGTEPKDDCKGVCRVRPTLVSLSPPELNAFLEEHGINEAAFRF